MQLLWKSLGLPACGRGLLSVEGSEQSRGAVCPGRGVVWSGGAGSERRGGEGGFCKRLECGASGAYRCIACGVCRARRGQGSGSEQLDKDSCHFLRQGRCGRDRCGEEFV